MHLFALLLKLFWRGTNVAAIRTATGHIQPYQNTQHRYRITFPSGWPLVNLRPSFVNVRAQAPDNSAAISIACRNDLWTGDNGGSARYREAWAALDGISIEIFKSRFENSDPLISPLIFSVDKVHVGQEKAIKVDYLLKSSVNQTSTRVRSFNLLRENCWYSVICETSESQPDRLLDVMLQSVNTFAFGRQPRY